MEANQINTIARSINANRNSFEGIIIDFRAYFGKVDVAGLKQAIAENEGAMKRAFELARAKGKGIQLSKEEKGCIKDMMEVGFGIAQINYEWLVLNLPMQYVSENGVPMEYKKDKITGIRVPVEVSKWTVLKVARYFRMAHVYAEQMSK